MNVFKEKIKNLIKEIDSILELYGKFLSEKQYANFLLAKKIITEIFSYNK